MYSKELWHKEVYGIFYLMIGGNLLGMRKKLTTKQGGRKHRIRHQSVVASSQNGLHPQRKTQERTQRIMKNDLSSSMKTVFIKMDFSFDIFQ